MVALVLVPLQNLQAFEMTHKTHHGFFFLRLEEMSGKISGVIPMCCERGQILPTAQPDERCEACITKLPNRRHSVENTKIGRDILCVRKALWSQKRSALWEKAYGPCLCLTEDDCLHRWCNPSCLRVRISALQTAALHLNQEDG